MSAGCYEPDPGDDCEDALQWIAWAEYWYSSGVDKEAAGRATSAIFRYWIAWRKADRALAELGL